MEIWDNDFFLTKTKSIGYRTAGQFSALVIAQQLQYVENILIFGFSVLKIIR
jgi:hypothetical protein